MLQNGFGSPRSVGSPNAGGDSDVGKIDTRAPFESVKAAVSLFGDVISPKSRPVPVVKKTKAEEVSMTYVMCTIHLPHAPSFSFKPFHKLKNTLSLSLLLNLFFVHKIMLVIIISCWVGLLCL